MIRIRVALLSLIPVLVTSPSFAQGNEEVVYFHTDAIGSVRLVTDANGQVVGRYDYLPFGEPWQPPPVPETRRFGGQERDAETGLDYFGARYYSSLNGRFTTVDPFLDVDNALVNPQLWNRFTYALNNPLTFTDPDGRNPLAVGGVIGAGVYAAWNVYQNVQQGRPWYVNIGLEASKGFLVGGTLGLVAPAFAGTAAADAIATAPLATAATSAGVRVIGKYPEYLQLAEQIGAKRFNIPLNVWGRMSDSERLAANAKFLERGVAAGERFVSTTRISDVLKQKDFSWLKHEIQYLLNAGYKVAEDGYTLIPR